MACGKNSILQRFGVKMLYVQGDMNPALAGLANGVIHFPQIVSVDGLTEGTQGTISIREQRGTHRIPDGNIVTPVVSLQLREDNDGLGETAKAFFDEWWRERENTLITIIVDITDRTWCIKYSYYFYSCTFLTRSIPAHVQGDSRIGIVDMQFEPYYVEKLDVATQIGRAAGF